MTKARLPFDALFLITLSGGCTAANPTTVAVPVSAQGRRMNVITWADMATFSNLYDAVWLLRPKWLSARGANAGHQPAVYLDGALTPGRQRTLQY